MEARRPGPVNLKSGNIEAEWSRFKQKFEIFLNTPQNKRATSTEKWALLLTEAGDDALEVYNSFKDKLITRTVNEQSGEITEINLTEDYKAVMQEFDSYAAQKKSLTGCREVFNQRNQKENEPFSNWLTDLKNLVKHCEYKDLTDSMLKDRIVWGVLDKRLKQTLRCKPNLTLQEVIDICKAIESTSQPSVVEDAQVEVDALRLYGQQSNKRGRGQWRGRGGRGRGEYRARGRGEYRGTQRGGVSKTVHRGRGYGRGGRGKQLNRGGQGNTADPKKYQCRKCNKWHEARNCPAWNQQCNTCGGWNHFSVVCAEESKSKTGNNKVVNTTQIVDGNEDETGSYILDSWATESNGELNELTSESINGYFVNVHMLSVASNTKTVIVSGEGKSVRPRKEYTEILKLGHEHYVKFKLDPGSEVNILPVPVFNIINKRGQFEVIPTKTVVKSYGKVLSATNGKVVLSVETKYGYKIDKCEFLLSSVEDRPLLGIEDCDTLNLVKRVENQKEVNAINSLECTKAKLPKSKEKLVEMFKETFTGLGEFKQIVKIVVDPTVQPGMCPPRRYNFSINNRLKRSLDDLEKRGIITKVKGEMPKFVSNLVIREKANGDLRLCLDPEILNTAIIRQQYPIPTAEEIACKIANKRVFTVLDLKDGFWHATLDEESSLLCSFSTPYGIYRFRKMPFGISCAPEIFQYLTDQAFNGTGAIFYFDDGLIAGKDEAEHDQILIRVMQRAKDQNIRFNPNKLQYRLTEVKFVGHLWSLNKIKVDPERVRAILALKAPQTKKQVSKVLGTFNYLRKFIPQMSNIAAPLYGLLSDSVHFHWYPSHAEAFEKLKMAICAAPVLATFDPKKSIVVQADASQSGLGACILQDGQPVAYASRVLTEGERNYAQIEKEMLALCYAASKFDHYVYGMPSVIFHADHQPLVSLFRKPIHKITNNRLKKMRLRMLRYQPKVVYLPGKYMYIADILSRQSLDDPVSDDPEMIEVVHEVTNHLPLSEAIKTDLITETAKDIGLCAVMQYYKNGWPRDRNKVVHEAKPYWQLRNELFVEADLVVFEDRVVVPVKLRNKVLKTLHVAHLGIEKTKARARQIVYWPGLTNDINTFVSQCRICERHSATNFKEPLQPHEIPEQRFQKVSADILEISSNCFLVVEDNFSKWLGLKKIPNKSAKSVIEVLRELFSVHGIPEVIFGDNNPLNSYECKEYAASIGSKIVTSSPNYPRSNGLAEKGVHIAKQLLKKCMEDGTHYLDAIREYNNTPLSGVGVSPAQILMSRMCRTVIPVLQKNLEPKIVNVRPILEKIQNEVKTQHDKHARRKPVVFKTGDQVVVQKQQKGNWEKGKIVQKHRASRSYVVEQLTGRQIRRNTFHIKKSNTVPDRHDFRFKPYDITGLLARRENAQGQNNQETSRNQTENGSFLHNTNDFSSRSMINTGNVSKFGRLLRAPERLQMT